MRTAEQRAYMIARTDAQRRAEKLEIEGNYADALTLREAIAQASLRMRQSFIWLATDTLKRALTETRPKQEVEHA